MTGNENVDLAKIDRGILPVFVENPAGSLTKQHHDEVSLVPTELEPVSRPYPYAYGFVVGVLSGDGDCLDCFVLSDREVQRGETVDCVPIAVLEQYQNGDDDHDLIAVPCDEDVALFEAELERSIEQLRSFIDHVFDHDPLRTLRHGKLLGSSAAQTLVAQLARGKHVDFATLSK